MIGRLPTAATGIFTICTACTPTQMVQLQRKQNPELRKRPRRWHPVHPLVLSALAHPAKRTLCREHTFLSRTLPEDISSIMNVISAIMFKIWGLMCIKTTVPARMVRGLARTAAAIHGFSRMSRQQPVPATVIVRTSARAVRQKVKPSMQAATVIATEAGNSIRPVSIGAPVLAETAVQRTTIMLRTA